MIYYHRIVYPDGRAFEGRVNHQHDINALGIKNVDGLRVLDIATNDGFFAFWAEQHGASEVIAIDVGNYQNYDWGLDGPPKDVDLLPQQDKWMAFDFHHHNLKSKVIKKEMSIYDIDSLGEFDVIFNYGLVYHLRNPILALDKCRKVCRGYMVLETASSYVNRYLPVTISMGEETGVGSCTDTFLPTTSAVASWMLKACFPKIYALGGKAGKRTTVVGVVDPKYSEMFEKCEPCDERFWEKVRDTVRQLIPDQP